MSKSALTMAGVIGGGGAAAAGGYSIYSAIQPKTIKEKLLKENFHLVSDIKDSSKLDKEWEKVLNRYKVEVNDTSKIIEKDKGSVTKEEIKKWCGDNLDSKINDSLYSKASKWCVTFTSLSEKLTSTGKQLSTNATSLKSKYDTMSEALKGEINKITVSSGTPQEGEKTKLWCSDLSKRAFISEEDTHYRNLIQYCV
ncbi:hypothetical protein HF1_04910 [Mycoplasma haemofelis str. Langford 1]|uniref:Uncharacterized protein n=1 Tax=Mycoplasma haemofelis (strain Langford 1) TaxID=941640 RepID=E8ZH78_MYCHL|nr:hypothetical protein [Mycoplasma haemofelis]CBY92499.1 hypothetical protein HF1_04910 [Mycoplasma haemofelis str. Langford 1]